VIFALTSIKHKPIAARYWVTLLLMDLWWVLVGLVPLGNAVDDAAKQNEELAFFESRIRPLLLQHCVECHGEHVQEGALRLDTRQGWMRGGKSGPAIVPGLPEKSLVVLAVRHADKDLKMPPSSRLNPDELSAITKWVRSGAVDPRDGPMVESSPSPDTWNEEFQRRMDWWSLKPLNATQPPEASFAAWAEQPVDRFLSHRMQQEGLGPASPAEPEVLLRRMSFVLTGLPPSTELRDSFLKMHHQDSQTAISWLVECLLASPHFGERMARHWMDAARYTDTYGYEWDNPAKGSHEYRDYLIRAFNDDLPYDMFVREQLAGDLISEPRIHQQLQINESVIGPMFYHLGEHRHGSSLAFNGIHQEMVHNKIDAFSKLFLATTVACARCHDHKREAISQREYYALGAMLMTPRWVSRPADAPSKNAPAIARLRELRSQIGCLVRQQWQGWHLERMALEAVIDKYTKSKKSPVLEDVAYPLVQLWSPVSSPSESWTAVMAEYESARQSRRMQLSNFQSLADVKQAQLPSGWIIEGEGIESGWVDDGEVLVSLHEDRVVGQLLPAGWHTHALSSKLPGVLRMPPQHEVPGKYVSVLIAGGEYSGALVMDENSFQNETVTFFKQPQPGWRSFSDAALLNGVTRVTIDFATASLNANFPPRTGLAAGLPANDLGFDKRSWMSILNVVSHDAPNAPKDSLDAFATLLAMSPPDSQEQLRCQLSSWFEQAVVRWCQDRVQPGDITLVNWLLSEGLLPNSTSMNSQLNQCLLEYRQIENEIDFPRTVNSMDERNVHRAGLYFNVRGNVDSMGELVMPDTLKMLGDPTGVAQSSGSGRLELANSLLRPEHPLTTRVYVNRVWQWVFGNGLVTTPDDFGRLGQQPSHPELLDWLARDFQRHGWSTKSLVRQLVLSRAFQQSGNVSPLALELDPQNRLWHHFPTRRLEAESIRDSLLSVSGRLDRRLYGRPINPPRAVEDAAKRLFSGPIDGHGRRSIYLTMSIMAPPKFLMSFDLPDLKLPNGKRSVTHVPAQALQLLNDPLVEQLSVQWSQAILRCAHDSPEERLKLMFLGAYARVPEANELSRWKKFIEELSPHSDVMSDSNVWRQVAHTIFNTKEFIYYR
jgi:mono/diheme cytochrome c family protein